MKRIEGSFVPSLNNVNLCNTTQIVSFRFLKIVSSQYNSSTSTQLKAKQTNKKRTKTRKTIVLCIKHRYRADKRFTLCVLVHVHKTYRTTHLNYWGRQLLLPTPHPHSHSLRLGGWWERPFPYFFKRPPPYPHSTAWLEEQSGTLLPMAHKIIRVPSPGFT